MLSRPFIRRPPSTVRRAMQQPRLLHRATIFREHQVDRWVDAVHKTPETLLAVVLYHLAAAGVTPDTPAQGHGIQRAFSPIVEGLAGEFENSTRTYGGDAKTEGPNLTLADNIPAQRSVKFRADSLSSLILYLGRIQDDHLTMLATSAGIIHSASGHHVCNSDHD